MFSISFLTQRRGWWLELSVKLGESLEDDIELAASSAIADFCLFVVASVSKDDKHHLSVIMYTTTNLCKFM